jgi:hypothetical protein
MEGHPRATGTSWQTFAWWYRPWSGWRDAIRSLWFAGCAAGPCQRSIQWGYRSCGYALSRADFWIYSLRDFPKWAEPEICGLQSVGKPGLAVN